MKSQSLTKSCFKDLSDKKRYTQNHDILRYDMGYCPIKFYLKQYSSISKQSQIVLSVSILGIRYRICTRMRIEPAFWDRSGQRCLDSELLCARVRKRSRGINENLDRIISDIEKKDRILAERGEFLTKDHLRDIIVNVVQPTPNNQTESPLDIMKTLARNYANQLNSKGRKGTSSSAQTYLMTVARLERFVKETRFNLNSFSCFNKTFFDKFKEYLVNYQFRKGEKLLKYTANTVINTIGVINILTHKAYDLNLGGETYYKGNCSILHETTAKIYLTEKELERLKQVKTLNLHETHIRDMFLIASYTALRISDINRLNMASFKNGTISLQQKKTKNCVCIPVLKEIGDIIGKYEREGFPTINVASANKCIKELAKRSGINEIILIPEIRGGEKTVRQTPKYSQVSFHTARRSCITNLYKRGYAINHLMSLSGHRSIASLQRYIKADAGEMSQEFIKELKKNKDI